MAVESVEQVEHLDLPLNLNIYPSEKNPRKTFNEKDDADLRDSLENKGQVEEIKLRKTESGYEIVDGQRRWQQIKKLEWKTIKAEVSGIGDFEAQNIRLLVLFMRKGVTEQEIEAAVYSHYLDGRAKGIFIGKRDDGIGTITEDEGFNEMHRQTGIDRVRILRYVRAAEERLVIKYKLGDELTSKITASDLYTVRPIKNNEFLWLKLLKRRANKEIKSLTELAQAVKTIKEAPSDVAQAVAEGTLDTDYAEQISKVDSKEEREKLIKEAVNIKYEQDADEKRFQAEVQKVQEGDIVINEEQREAAIAALEHDQHVLRDLKSMYLNAKATIRADHIMAVSTPEKMAECIKFVKKTLEIYENVLASAPRNIGVENYLEATYSE